MLSDVCHACRVGSHQHCHEQVRVFRETVDCRCQGEGHPVAVIATLSIPGSPNRHDRHFRNLQDLDEFLRRNVVNLHATKMEVS